LLAFAGPGVARAQPSGAAAPTLPPSPTPPPTPPQPPAAPAAPELDTSTLGDAGSAALDLFRGAAALGTVATCRTGAYATEAPTRPGITVKGDLLDREADLVNLLNSAIPWTKKGRPYDEDGCQALRHVLDQLRYRADLTETAVADGVVIDLNLT